jgi:hypothetical protein
MPSIRTSIEGKRGCGYRVAGGLYLVGGYPGDNCHRLPFELHACNTCGQGIKPSRSWTWIDAVELFSPACEGFFAGVESTHCINCVVCNPFLLAPQREFKGEAPLNFGKSGLIWIGERFYATPETFIEEANRMGVSRRVGAVPKGFVLGETWVFFAHRKALPDHDNPSVDSRHPGIFEAFKPTAIEYVVTGDETTEELERIEDRGISLVAVERDATEMALPMEEIK